MNPFEYRQRAATLDFYAVLPDGSLVRRRVRLRVITGFGLAYEPVFTATGTFSRWQVWGYLRAGRLSYRVSPRLVRAWQRAWRWALLAKRECIGQRGSGRSYRVHEWDFSIVAFARRGSVQPRRWDGQAAPALTQAPVVTKN